MNDPIVSVRIFAQHPQVLTTINVNLSNKMNTSTTVSGYGNLVSLSFSPKPSSASSGVPSEETNSSSRPQAWFEDVEQKYLSPKHDRQTEGVTCT